MQIITPIDITEDMLNSTIAEPDTTSGEVEWADRKSPSYYDYIYNSSGDDSSGYVTSAVADNGKVFFAGGEIGVLNTGGTTEFISDPVIQIGSASAYGDYVYFGAIGSGAITKMNADTLVSSTISTSQGDAIGASVTTSSGLIYFFTDTEVLILDPADDSIDYVTVDVSDISDVAEGLDGNLYFITSSWSDGTSVYKMDVNSDEVSLLAGLSGRYNSIVSGDNGFMYIAGYTGDIAVYGISSQEVSTFGVVPGIIFDMVFAGDDLIMAAGSSSNGYGAAFAIDISLSSVSEVFSDQYPVVDGATSAPVRTINKRDGRYVFSFFSYSEAGKIGRFSPPYLSGEQVISTTSHKVYQAILTSYDDPIIGAELTPPSWVELYATNKWRMFDYVVNTKSSGSGAIELLPSSASTTLSLYGVSNISSVNVTVRENNSSGSIIYSKDIDLTLDSPVDDLIVNDNLYKSKAMFDGMPVYSSPWIQITPTVASGFSEWSIGDIVIGNARTLGKMTYLSSTSRTSYDIVETDDYGNETIISRPSAEYTTFEMVVFPQYADYVERILKDSLNMPRVYVGDKQLGEKMFTFGYYERSPISYDDPSLCTTTLKVRGLV